MKDNKYLYLIFAGIGFIFLRSSYGKFTGGKFVATLADTLTKLAGKNPNPWYKSFLTDTAVPNSTIFGVLTMWGELFAGAVLLCISAYLLVQQRPTKLVYMLLGAGLLTGAFLNATFWLASGYTSPSTDGLNLVMFLIEAIGVFFVMNKLAISEK